MDAANEMFSAADKVQHKPLSDDQWADAVECYQRTKLMTDAVSDLVKAFAEQTGKTTTAIRSVLKAKADSKESEMRDDLQGRLELLGGAAMNPNDGGPAAEYIEVSTERARAIAMIDGALIKAGG